MATPFAALAREAEPLSFPVTASLAHMGYACAIISPSRIIESTSA